MLSVRCLVMMTVAIATASTAPVVNTAFNLAEIDAHGDDLVVVNGRPANAFVENALFTDFFASLTKGSNVTKQKFRIDKFDWEPKSENFLAELEEWIPQRDYEVTQDAAALLPVVYFCKDNTGQYSQYNLTMTFEFLDTNFTDLTVHWTKFCFPKTQPGEKTSEKWNTAEVFFFSVFLIGLIGCVVGCGYNYVLHNKSGVEMIPCVNLCRRGLDRIRGRSDNSYTPDIDYQSNDDEYGAVYQTEL